VVRIHAGEPKFRIPTFALVDSIARFGNSVSIPNIREVLRLWVVSPSIWFGAPVASLTWPPGRGSDRNSPFSPIDRSRLLTASSVLGSHKSLL